MTMHGSTRAEGAHCTVKRLIELLSDIQPEALVYCAIGEDENGSPVVGTVLSVSEIRDPFDQGDHRVALIVPNGALRESYLAMLASQASEPDPTPEDPS